MRSATVRFYFDADILGLAKLLTTVRSDVTYPGDPGGTVHKRIRPACPIKGVDVPDAIWIPEGARNSGLIVTRDSRIQSHRLEIEAVRSNAACMVALAGAEARTTWAQLEIVMCQWRSIERCLDEPGPFIYNATRTRLQRVPL